MSHCTVTKQDEADRQAAENERAYHIRKCHAAKVNLNARRILAAIDGNKYVFENLTVRGATVDGRIYAVKVEFLGRTVYLCATGKVPTVARFDESWTSLLKKRADYMAQQAAKCRAERTVYRSKTRRTRENFGF